MDKFEVGEIAIFVDPEFKGNGQEVEIMSELIEDYIIHLKRKDFVHDIKSVATVEEGCAAPRYLRKKRPPKREIDKKVEWKDVGWIPKDLRIPTLTEVVK